jgi:sulfatase modifying factor 1
MEMVLIKAGEFNMGSNDGEECEKPVHLVKISKPFYMGKYHVTVAQFRAFADATGYETEAEKACDASTWKDGNWQNVKGTSWKTPGFRQTENYPACVITWNDAQEFVKWAAEKTGRKVCLPTEAQWDLAARAGKEGLKDPWGYTMPPESIDVHNSESPISFFRDGDFHGSPSIVD